MLIFFLPCMLATPHENILHLQTTYLQTRWLPSAPSSLHQRATLCSCHQTPSLIIVCADWKTPHPLSSSQWLPASGSKFWHKCTKRGRLNSSVLPELPNPRLTRPTGGLLALHHTEKDPKQRFFFLVHWLSYFTQQKKFFHLAFMSWLHLLPLLLVVNLTCKLLWIKYQPNKCKLLYSAWDDLSKEV